MKIVNYNPRRYPSPEERVGLGRVLCAVLVEQEEGMKCYGAILPDRGDGKYDLEWVAAHGNLLDFAEAKTHFPGLRREFYAH